MNCHVVVLSGGAQSDLRLTRLLSRSLSGVDLVIAADSGLSRAEGLGLNVTTAIGDFDSVDPEVLARAKVQGVEIVPFPADKDATDLELALELAVERGATHITVLSGGPGERLDHFLGEVGVLTAPFLSACIVSGWFGEARISVVRPDRVLRISGTANDLVTLLPVTPKVEGVSTTNLRYPLSNETLHAWRTRGVSNVMLTFDAEISISAGVLLVVQPDALAQESS